MVDWQLAGKQLPQIDVDPEREVPYVIIRNISKSDFLTHVDYWIETGIIATEYVDWQPQTGTDDLGEVVVYEMASFWHESIVRELDRAIERAMDNIGLQNSDRLEPFGSIRGIAGIPNGSWAPQLTPTESANLTRAAARDRKIIRDRICPYSLVIEVGASQTMDELINKFRTQYVEKFVWPWPTVFVAARVIPFVNCVKQPFIRWDYHEPPDICLRFVVYRRDGDRIALVQELQAGNVD